MAIVTDSRLQETFSLALEWRSKGYQDLVSNANAILSIMKQRKGFQSFNGPTIRIRLLYNETGSYIRYSGYDFLNPQPAELINDAEFTPKMAAVSVVLTGEEILKNSGEAQLLDVMGTHMDAAEQELQDRFVEDLHSAGSETNQIGGLQKAIPTTTNSGTYGSISRANYSIWRTTTYDANSAFTGITAVSSTTIQSIFDQIMYARSRGTRGPTVIVASAEHYAAYSAALQGIQQIHNQSDDGVKGFTHLMYAGNGKRVPVVAETGIGSAMPSNASYFIDMNSLKFRYHPDRNFEAFGGKMRPINQDAIVQHIGFMGELTLENPLHMVKLYDSTP